jgi:hypothetical protein
MYAVTTGLEYDMSKYDGIVGEIIRPLVEREVQNPVAVMANDQKISLIDRNKIRIDDLLTDTKVATELNEDLRPHLLQLCRQVLYHVRLLDEEEARRGKFDPATEFNLPVAGSAHIAKGDMVMTESLNQPAPWMNGHSYCDKGAGCTHGRTKHAAHCRFCGLSDATWVQSVPCAGNPSKLVGKYEGEDKRGK